MKSILLIIFSISVTIVAILDVTTITHILTAIIAGAITYISITKQQQEIDIYMVNKN